MRISDWSSDVCSSDLRDAFGSHPPSPVQTRYMVQYARRRKRCRSARLRNWGRSISPHGSSQLTIFSQRSLTPIWEDFSVAQCGGTTCGASRPMEKQSARKPKNTCGDRKRVGEGKSVTVSVDYG